MKKIQILVSIVMMFTPMQMVFAQVAHAEDTISGNTVQRCEFSQRYLNNTLKTRDIRARVNRLQAYRYIYQRLDIFTNRLEHNQQIGSVDFRNNMNEFSKKIELFKSGYEEYDLSREVVAKYKNCGQDPEGFLNKLQIMRDSRQKINNDVADIQELLDVKFKSSLQQLNLDLTSPSIPEVKND